MRLFTFLTLFLFSLPFSISSIPYPFTILNPNNFSQYLNEDFNWALTSIPFFESSDENLTLSYYFRWRIYYRHIHSTGYSPIPYVITEFTPNVPWAGSNNTIPCASGHHINEGRWLRDTTNSTSLHPIDSYIQWWPSNLPGIKQNYYYWLSNAVMQRLQMIGQSNSIFISILQNIVPNIASIMERYMNGYLPGNAAYDSVDDCIWNVPGNEGQENSISGPGCRPLVQALLYGEAKALVELCTIIQNTTCITEFTNQKLKFQQRLLNLWNANITGFDTWRIASPPSPPPPMPPGWNLYTNASIFCCDQSPCHNGHSTFLYEGPLNTDDCVAKCNSFGSNICHFVTTEPNDPWCQVAQYCNTTNPFAGGTAYTFIRNSTTTTTTTIDKEINLSTPSFAQVRELASLSSPWYFDAVPHSNASFYADSWNTLFDPEGLLGTYGLRTAEARHPQYNCHRASCCWWDGPSWPFETSKVLTAMVRILHDINDLSPQLPIITRDRLHTLFQQYTLMHTSSWLITNGSNTAPANYNILNNSGLFLSGLGTAWFAEAGCADDSTWTDNPLEGYWYLHSTYIDILLQMIPGIIPQAGNSTNPTVTIHPLQPSDNTYTYWAIDGILINNHSLGICWDLVGNHYSYGQGLYIFVDGKLVQSANTTQGLPIIINLN